MYRYRSLTPLLALGSHGPLFCFALLTEFRYFLLFCGWPRLLQNYKVLASVADVLMPCLQLDACSWDEARQGKAPRSYAKPQPSTTRRLLPLLSKSLSLDSKANTYHRGSKILPFILLKERIKSGSGSGTVALHSSFRQR